MLYTYRIKLIMQTFKVRCNKVLNLKTHLGPFKDAVETEVVLTVFWCCNRLAAERVEADGTLI